MSDFFAPGGDVDGGLYTQAALESGNTALTRLVFPVNETCGLLGNASRASLYRWIAAGRLDARKIDGKTVITAESIARFAADLPKAEIRPVSPPQN
jgi:helix-turn-helix protein